MVDVNIEELLRWDAEHIMHSVFPVGENAGLLVEEAEGVMFKDARGKEYIDGSSQLILPRKPGPQGQVRDHWLCPKK
ncbi:MAG: hypothetical protein JRJ29_19225 [Deltaproteobacteria bacterium]|nr:hypothetical protein [Deltaproteobacteria bacterium]